MTPARRAENLARTEHELRAEQAAALGRAGERLEQALADVAALAAQYHRSTDSAERRRLARAYEAARQRAATARTALLIQREACGIRHHAMVDHVFPEPLGLNHTETRVSDSHRGSGEAEAGGARPEVSPGRREALEAVAGAGGEGQPPGR